MILAAQAISVILAIFQTIQGLVKFGMEIIKYDFEITEDKAAFLGGLAGILLRLGILWYLAYVLNFLI